MPSPKKDFEERELEEIIRKQAEYASQLQRTITDGQAMERYVSDGHFDFLEQRVFSAIERRAFLTIKSPDFDPSNLSQVAQLKALCQTMDLIRGEVNGQVATVKDARAKLNDLQASTPTL